MMTKPLLAILLLLPLSVSAGELDGKSLICERVNIDSVFGYRFQQGRENRLFDRFQIREKENGEMDVIGKFEIRKTSSLLEDTSRRG